MPVRTYRRLRILHVEDNVGDVRLIAEALKETGRDHDIAVARDGVEALDYLYRRGGYVDAWRPDLILLDLNLPKKSGLEVLAEIKADEQLRHVPVVVFTSSSAPQDIDQAYAANSSCYITKPAELDELFRVVAQLENYWVNIVTLPPDSGGRTGGGRENPEND